MGEEALRRNQRARAGRLGVRAAGFFLPLMLAAAFLNVGQTQCSCNDSSCATPPAAAPPAAVQVGDLPHVIVSATIPSTEPSRIRFYRDGVLIGERDTDPPSYDAAEWTDTAGLVVGNTYAYTVDYFALPNGYVSYASQATNVTIVGPAAPAAPTADQILGTLDVRLSAMVPANALASFYRDGAPIGTVTAPASGQVEFVDSSLQPDRVYSYHATYTEASGGPESQPSPTVSIIILPATFMCGSTECGRAKADSCFGVDECACGEGLPCGFGQHCVDGACRCNSDSCLHGCCEGDTCIHAVEQDLSTCGVNGSACGACNLYTSSMCSAGLGCFCGFSPACAAGSRCDGGYCACDEESCPGGCCDGTSCVTGHDFPACGAPGTSCTICDPDRGDDCGASGQCECGEGGQCDEGVLCFEGRCGCQGSECEGGFWSPADGESVTDTTTPVDVAVFTLFPRQSIQLQVAINISEEVWVDLGAPIVTPYTSTGDIRGVPIYEATTQVVVPTSYWVEGTSGFRANIRGVLSDSSSGYLNSYPNFDGCLTSPTFQDSTGEELVTQCNYTGRTAARVQTSDYAPFTGTPPTLLLLSNDCGSISVSVDTPGHAYEYYRDGIADGIAAGSLGNFPTVPGHTYSLRARKTSGSPSELGPPLVVTTPFCSPPGGFSDGVLDMGVYLVAWEEVAATNPITPQDLHHVTFDSPQSVNEYVKEVSRGRASLTGTTYGWSVYSGSSILDHCTGLEPDGTGTWCDPQSYALSVQHAKDNLPFYDHEYPTVLVYGVNRGGIAGGTHATFKAQLSSNTFWYAHESLGHGLAGRHGTVHAHAIQCPGGQFPEDLRNLGSDCSVTYQGDMYDPMGGNQFHYNTFNLLRFGWLDSHEVEISPETSGVTSHAVGALLRDTYSTKQLRVPLQGPFFLGLEFRNQDGFNGLSECTDCVPIIYNCSSIVLGCTPPVTGVQMRLSDGALNTYLVRDANGVPVLLQNGESFVDEARGTTIRVVEMSYDGAVVEIER